MAIQDFLSPSLLTSQDRRPGLFSAEHDQLLAGKNIHELPMSGERSASSELSVQDSSESTASGFSSFSASSVQELSTWPTSRSDCNANNFHPIVGGFWNSDFDSDYEEHLKSIDYYHCQSIDHSTSRRVATKESTGMLKEWLRKNSKNPYPSKSEKVMLAMVTKMSLTQVSTWFANARRRLKKENKMTWIPKNRSNDFIDDSSQNGSPQDNLASDTKEFNSTNYDKAMHAAAELNCRNELACSVKQSESRLNYYPLPDMSTTFGKAVQSSPVSQHNLGHEPPTEFKTLDSHHNAGNRGQSSPVFTQAEGVYADGFVPSYHPPPSSECHHFNAYLSADKTFSAVSHAQNNTNEENIGRSSSQYLGDHLPQRPVLHLPDSYQQKSQFCRQEVGIEMSHQCYQIPEMSQYKSFSPHHFSGDRTCGIIANNASLPYTDTKTAYILPPCTRTGQLNFRKFSLPSYSYGNGSVEENPSSLGSFSCKPATNNGVFIASQPHCGATKALVVTGQNSSDQSANCLNVNNSTTSLRMTKRVLGQRQITKQTKQKFAARQN